MDVICRSGRGTGRTTQAVKIACDYVLANPNVVVDYYVPAMNRVKAVGEMLEKFLPPDEINRIRRQPTGFIELKNGSVIHLKSASRYLGESQTYVDPALQAVFFDDSEHLPIETLLDLYKRTPYRYFVEEDKKATHESNPREYSESYYKQDEEW